LAHAISGPDGKANPHMSLKWASAEFVDDRARFDLGY
jgi:hypothetical protein